MKNQFESKNLYILHIKEYVIYVPMSVEETYIPDYTNTTLIKEYHAMTFSKDETKFFDINRLKYYNKKGIVGFGVIRTIDSYVPITDIVDDINLNRKEANIILDNYIEKLNQKENKIIPLQKKLLRKEDYYGKQKIN